MCWGWRDKGKTNPLTSSSRSLHTIAERVYAWASGSSCREGLCLLEPTQNRFTAFLFTSKSYQMYYQKDVSWAALKPCRISLSHETTLHRSTAFITLNVGKVQIIINASRHLDLNSLFSTEATDPGVGWASKWDYRTHVAVSLPPARNSIPLHKAPRSSLLPK